VCLFKTAAMLPNKLYDRLFFGTSAVSWGSAAGHAIRWFTGGLLICVLAWLSLQVVSTAASGMLRSIYSFALPALGLISLAISRRMAGSSKVPILIAVMSIPVAAIVSLAMLLASSG
jgi:hypothetical protein